jgi:hypothetical protein
MLLLLHHPLGSLEADLGMRAVAEGLVGRSPATAERDRFLLSAVEDLQTARRFAIHYHSLSPSPKT